MMTPDTRSTPLGLHACCGPCSLMPVKRLRDQGFEPRIYYCNPNIVPDDEYRRRLATLTQWADGVGVTVEEVALPHTLWQETVARPYTAARAAGVEESKARPERCRRCYRLRFEAVAKACAQAGLTVMASTLSVSPYQYTDLIAEELNAAADQAGLNAHFEDYRPLYPEATREAIALGLYRQNYCGCELSAAEAERERQERRETRRQARLEREIAERPRREAEAQARRERTAERRAYEQERARRREVLRSLRGLK